MQRLLFFLMSLALVAAACTPTITEPTITSQGPTTTSPAAATTTTSPPRPWEEPLDRDKLNVVLMWHQHQPLYPKNEDGVVTRPWVRVHATKDYYDMAAMIEEFPEIQATFNLTPVLLLQLEELANGTKDLYWTHTEIPASELTDDERTFITDRFFDVNPLIVARFPRFQELADRRDDAASYSDQDITDLQVLFNLAWTDPRFLAEAPLDDVVSRGRDFTEDDKTTVLDRHLEIIKDVIEVHKRLWDTGQIEVTTTPFAHPILPLIADGSLASVGDPQAILPVNEFSEIPDATEQVRRGLAVAEEILGRKPVGMWPGEGAVAQLVMSLFSREGIQWVATGEHVLNPSIDPTRTGAFQRDSDGTVEDAATLYQPWNAQLNRNPDVAMFFRDVVISDLLGFQYSGMSAEQAAADLIDRLAAIDARLDESGSNEPKVVTIVLDGENAWENYPNDGIDHLEAIYRALSDADFLTTVTPSRYLAEFGDEIKPLPDVFPGAWFSSNYATWIGETEEATAWDYLYRTRDDLERAKNNLTDGAWELAFEAMLFAEGSDWFWWYGSDQSSGNDEYFDAAFRELLGQVYDGMGQDRPAFIGIPIIPQTAVTPVRSTNDLVTITIDNTISADEWAAGGEYAVNGGLIGELGWAFDKQNLYLRIDFNREVLGDDSAGLDFYLGVPSAPTKRATTLSGAVLGFGASHVVQWRGTDPVTVTAATELPADEQEDRFVNPESTSVAGFDGSSIEFAIPLEQLVGLETGDLLLFKAVEVVAGVTGQPVPIAGPAGAPVPDISDVEAFLTLTDPTGDDHGPGTYTYPGDSVFIPGAFDAIGVEIGLAGDELVVTTELAAPIANPWGSPNGLSIQTIDVYIDKDPGAGTGQRLLIDGRNAALTADDGWEYAVTIEGWDSALYVSTDNGTNETKPTLKIVVLGDKAKVIVRLPIELLGGGDPRTWGYAIAVLGQEGFPSSGVRRVRDVGAQSEQFRFGGAAVDVTHTRIIDLIWPDTGVQEDALSAYTSLPAFGNPIDPDDFAQIPLLVAE